MSAEPTGIPAEELARIERAAKDYTTKVNATPTGDRYCGYIAGAKSEYLRAASRIAELERLQKFIDEDNYIGETIKEKDDALIRIAELEKEIHELRDLLDRASSHLDVSYDSFQSREDLYNEIKKLLRCTI